MANRQTRYLATLEKGTRMLKGQQNPNNQHSSYAVVISRPLFKGSACDTSFANAPKNGSLRKHPRRYKPDTNMSVAVQMDMLGRRKRKASNE